MYTEYGIFSMPHYINYCIENKQKIAQRTNNIIINYFFVRLQFSFLYLLFKIIFLITVVPIIRIIIVILFLFLVCFFLIFFLFLAQCVYVD